MKGFSLIELFVAFALASILLLGSATLIFTLPGTLTDLEKESAAVSLARTTLQRFGITSKSHLSSLLYATTTNGIVNTFTIEPREDESVTSLTSEVSWSELFKTGKKLTLETRGVSDMSPNSACDTFVSGDWSHPVLVAQYSLIPGSFLGAGAPRGSYSISGLTSTASTLALTVGSTSSTRAPTLFFYSAHGTSPSLTLLGSFDNSTASNNGYSTVTTDGNFFYAGNAFGSKSTSTCSDALSCAQIHVYQLIGTLPQRTNTYALSTTSPPYARSATGESSVVTALTYYHQYLYVGLEKTATGNEFNIIDAHDPKNLRWVGGYRVGRSVTDIVVRGPYAYFTTDDPTRELLILDIRTPTAPKVAGSYDAPGSQGFGYGSTLSVRNSIVRLGRTYHASASELLLVDTTDPLHPALLQSSDEGTATDPESVRAFAAQDTNQFTLLTHRLEVWDTRTSLRMTTSTPAYMLAQYEEGVALTCRDNLIYLGHTSSQTGMSKLDILQAS